MDTASGDVTLGQTRGEVIVKTSSGDITLERAEASVRAQSASGDVRIGSVGQGNPERMRHLEQEISRNYNPARDELDFRK